MSNTMGFSVTGTGRGRGDFSVTVEDDDVEAAFQRAQEAMSPIMLMGFLTFEADEFMKKEIEARFRDEGDSATGPWLPLSETTNKIRRELGYPDVTPINERSGALRDALEADRDYRIIADGVQMDLPGTNLPDKVKNRLRVAQQGAPPGSNPKFPNSATPPRPVLGIQSGDIEQLMRLLSVYFERRILV